MQTPTDTCQTCCFLRRHYDEHGNRYHECGHHLRRCLTSPQAEACHFYLQSRLSAEAKLYNPITAHGTEE